MRYNSRSEKPRKVFVIIILKQWKQNPNKHLENCDHKCLGGDFPHADFLSHVRWKKRGSPYTLSTDWKVVDTAFSELVTSRWWGQVGRQPRHAMRKRGWTHVHLCRTSRGPVTWRTPHPFLPRGSPSRWMEVRAGHKWAKAISKIALSSPSATSF